MTSKKNRTNDDDAEGDRVAAEWEASQYETVELRIPPSMPLTEVLKALCGINADLVHVETHAKGRITLTLP